jgi:hypothetical protein
MQFDTEAKSFVVKNAAKVGFGVKVVASSRSCVIASVISGWISRASGQMQRKQCVSPHRFEKLEV